MESSTSSLNSYITSIQPMMNINSSMILKGSFDFNLIKVTVQLGAGK